MPSPSSIRELLRITLEVGDLHLGQVTIRSNLTLTHGEDVDRTDLSPFHQVRDAIEIAKYDDAGNYRPLKTAPNLRHGWKLHLSSIEEVHLALDFLYPAALGLWHAFAQEKLSPTSLRETLSRQTGMYAVVKKISDDEIHSLIKRVCNHESGCLRQILWPISGPDSQAPISAKGQIPLLCAEACNLFIAEGRKIVKSRPPESESASAGSGAHGSAA